ncbi:hypothetical protein PIB30_050709 [Stylosanthes scabra]|uniref:Uncharacterized protein n=1 Tax=Stylosanthes scabra TaxID=79078 RepID=A0ABU6VJB5_9FABA|nr:hypothetical protein [Stylosanthes scabra]
MGSNWENVRALNPVGVNGVAGLNTGIDAAGRRGEVFAESLLEVETIQDLGLDPMQLEAQLTMIWSRAKKVLNEKNKCGPLNSLTESAVGHGSGPSMSCPYPPGFGPCTNLIHVHRRAVNDAEIVRETQKGERENQAEESEGVSEMPIKVDAMAECEGVQVETDSEEEQSDETLYLINRDVRTRDEFLGLNGESSNVLIGPPNSAVAVEASDADVVRSEEPHFLNNDGVDNRDGERFIWGYTENEENEELELVGESGKKEAEKDCVLVEATDDEEEVLVRLVDRKLEGKKHVDLRPKKQRHGRKPPCI